MKFGACKVIFVAHADYIGIGIVGGKHRIGESTVALVAPSGVGLGELVG